MYIYSVIYKLDSGEHNVPILEKKVENEHLVSTIQCSKMGNAIQIYEASVPKLLWLHLMGGWFLQYLTSSLRKNSLSLSLHRPLQEFSHRLKASQRPSTPETVCQPASSVASRSIYIYVYTVHVCVYTLHLPNAMNQWCQWWQKHISSVKQCNKLVINMQCKIGIQYQCQTRSDPWPTSRIGDVPGPPGPKDKLSIACCTAPTWGNPLCTPQYPLGESHPWSFHWTSWPSWQSRKRVLGSETKTGIHAKNHRELAHQWLIPTKNHNKCTSISPACSNHNYLFCIYNSWLTQRRNNNRHNLATNVKLAKSPGIWQTIGNSMQWGQIYGRQYKNWPYWLTAMTGHRPGDQWKAVLTPCMLCFPKL